MSLLERFTKCKGLDAAGIAAELDDLEQDDVTLELLRIFGERTVVSDLPSVPFSVHHTMYGDLDVSEWVLRYTPDGVDVVAAEPGAAADVKMRWEHWEDAVRLLNADANEGILLFTRRAAIDGDRAAGLVGQQWLAAVDFAGTGDIGGRPGVLVQRLRTAAWTGEAELNAYIEATGLPRLLWARAVNMAASIADGGAGEGLGGSFMRLEIASQPPVGAHTEFSVGGGAADTRILDADELGTEDGERGVTLRWESVGAFVDAVTFKEEMPQQFTNGRLRALGSPPRLMAFSEAMSKLADSLRPAAPS